MTTSRRLAPLPLLLIGLAVLAALVLIPWVVHAQTKTNQDATGRPVILASAEGAPILFADTSGISDGNGLPFSGEAESVIKFLYSYQWIRVDGNTETNVGADSPRYHRVDADIGKLIKVQVSFEDQDDFEETVTSLPFGPVAEPAGPSRPATTLVSNTGQSASATANITQQYAMEFTLGSHGQGYELSSVSIELAAVPSDLTVSLWIGNHSDRSSVPQTKLFDFGNPSPLVVGMNKFTPRRYIITPPFTTAAVGEEEGQTQVEDEAGPVRRRLGEGHRASAAVGRRSGSQRDNYPGASRRSVPGQIRQIPAEDSAAADEGLQGATWTRQGGVL